MQSLDNVLLLKEEKSIQHWDASLLLKETSDLKRGRRFKGGRSLCQKLDSTLLLGEDGAYPKFG